MRMGRYLRRYGNKCWQLNKEFQLWHADFNLAIKNIQILEPLYPEQFISDKKSHS